VACSTRTAAGTRRRKGAGAAHTSIGIEWTRPNTQQIAIATRADVAKLDAFVGPKR
jgi:hypothetical protein